MSRLKYIIPLAVILILCTIYFGYLQFCVISHERSYTPVPSDAILVLGHSINSEDHTPDRWLVLRLESALKLYNEGYAAKIIVSGGKAPNDSISVAQAMESWFINNGVDSDNIFVEDKSTTTEENFKYSKIISDANGIESIIVATNDFHMYRAMAIANDYFLKISGYASDVSFDFNKFLAYVKEPLSLVKYELLRFFQA